MDGGVSGEGSLAEVPRARTSMLDTACGMDASASWKSDLRRALVFGSVRAHVQNVHVHVHTEEAGDTLMSHFRHAQYQLSIACPRVK